MDGATFTLLGTLLIGLIGGIAIGFGWGRISGVEAGRKLHHYDPTDEAGA